MSNWQHLKPSIIFNCPDVPPEYEALSTKGVEFLERPKKMSWGTYARFKDPDGNEFLLRSDE